MNEAAGAARRLGRGPLYAAFVVFLMSFSGCAVKQPVYSASYVIVFKTPKWRFADTGYIRTGDGVAEIEVFEAGQQVLQLRVEGRMVCVEDKGCLTKAAFNAKYLSSGYPDDFFYHLLRGDPIMMGSDAMPIMEAMCFVRTDTGFEQYIDGIVYRVSASEIYFKDPRRRILIKFRKLD